jgi:predicted nucleic-acid-binding protein
MQILDTNVLIRFLLRDDPVQSPKAYQFIRSAAESGRSLAVPDVILTELFWALATMGLQRQEILKVVIPILDNDVFRFEDHERAAMAVGLWAEHKIDFADAYIAARYNTDKAEGVVSFDQDFKRLPVRWIQP